VQTVEHVAEVAALGVEIESGAQNETHLAARRFDRGLIQLHSLRRVAKVERVIPDALVGLRADVLTPPIEHHRNETLGNAEVLCQLGL